MLIVHDVVEIDADDTFCYDPQGMASKEEKSGGRRSGSSPDPEPGGSELKALWEEFEARQTPEARFAAAPTAARTQLFDGRRHVAGVRRHLRSGHAAVTSHRRRLRGAVGLRAGIDRGSRPARGHREVATRRVPPGLRRATAGRRPGFRPGPG